MPMYCLFSDVSLALRHLCTALVFCLTLVLGCNLTTPEDSTDSPTSIPMVVDHALVRPFASSRIAIIRCTSVRFLVRTPVLFTICGLILMRSEAGIEDFPHFAPNPDFNTYRLGGDQQEIELDWHRQLLENPRRRPDQYVPTSGKGRSATSTSATTRTMTTTKRASVVPPTSSKPKDWTFMFHDEFNLSARWAFAVLALCFSIPAIWSWGLPLISKYARKIVSYVCSVLAICVWLIVLVLFLRGPAKSMITSRVPSALSHYADASASILVIPFLSFLSAFVMFLMFELFLHRVLISKQVNRLFTHARTALNRMLPRADTQVVFSGSSIARLFR